MTEALQSEVLAQLDEGVEALLSNEVNACMPGVGCVIVAKDEEMVPSNTPAEAEEAGESLSLNVARGLVLMSAALYGTNFGSVKILQVAAPSPLNP